MEYSDVNRGQPQNRERMMQIIRFDDMRYGKGRSITPTDIDGFFEENDRVYVFFELKYSDAIHQFRGGQRLALERLVNALSETGRISALFLCKHNVKNCSADVMAKSARVEKVYFNGSWNDWDGRNLKESVDCFMRKYGDCNDG